MDRTLIISVIILSFSTGNLQGQDQETSLNPDEGKRTILYGFIRGGLYGSH